MGHSRYLSMYECLRIREEIRKWSIHYMQKNYAQAWGLKADTELDGWLLLPCICDVRPNKEKIYMYMAFWMALETSCIPNGLGRAKQNLRLSTNHDHYPFCIFNEKCVAQTWKNSGLIWYILGPPTLFLHARL